MERRADYAANQSVQFYTDPSFAASRVKMVQPVNAAVIIGLAVTCWLPLAGWAYLLAR
jgi:hypothetical protein